MKNYISIIIFACCFSVSSYAQTSIKPGFRAGANFARFSDTDFDFKTNFYVGGFVTLKLSRFYSLQPEINYSAQGAKADFSNLSDVGHAPSDISVNYLSFGVLNKFTFTDEFSLMAGPAIDFETYSNVNTNSGIDLSLTAGLGYTLHFGLTIEGRAKFGIIDVLESDDYNNSNNFVDDWNTNIVLQLGVSYSFDAKGATK